MRLGSSVSGMLSDLVSLNLYFDRFSRPPEVDEAAEVFEAAEAVLDALLLF